MGRFSLIVVEFGSNVCLNIYMQEVYMFIYSEQTIATFNVLLEKFIVARASMETAVKMKMIMMMMSE